MANNRSKRRPRAPKPPLEEEEGRDEPEEELEPVTKEPELEEDILGEIDDESRFAVSVFRRIESGPRVGKPEYMGRLTPAEFSLDTVRERFGGGTFEVRTLRRDERSNREKITRTRTVHVAGPPRAIVTDGAPPAGSPVAVVSPPQSETERLLREELERSRRARVAMRRKLEELAKPKAGPLEWLEKLAPLLAPFLKPSRGGTEEFVRALELGVKLGSRGNGDDGGSIGPVLDKALGVVAAIADKHPNGAASASSQTAPALLPGSPNGAASPPAAAKMAPLWVQRAAPYFPALVAWARAGDDPATRVGFVLGALDQQTRDELGAAAEAEDFVPNALAALPPLFRDASLVTWTTRFLQLLQDGLAPEEEEEEEEEVNRGE